MKRIYKQILASILLLTVILIIESCNFRIIKVVGSQISSSINWSKEFEVFLCSYSPESNSIEKHKKYKINQVFAEYQYNHDGELFSEYKIDLKTSQIIITDSIKDNSWRNDSCSFSIMEFKTRSGLLYYKMIDNTMIQDTLILQIVIADFRADKKEVDELIYIKDR